MGLGRGKFDVLSRWMTAYRALIYCFGVYMSAGMAVFTLSGLISIPVSNSLSQWQTTHDPRDRSPPSPPQYRLHHTDAPTALHNLP